MIIHTKFQQAIMVCPAKADTISASAKTVIDPLAQGKNLTENQQFNCLLG